MRARRLTHFRSDFEPWKVLIKSLRGMPQTLMAMRMISRSWSRTASRICAGYRNRVETRGRELEELEQFAQFLHFLDGGRVAAALLGNDFLGFVELALEGGKAFLRLYRVGSGVDLLVIIIVAGGRLLAAWAASAISSADGTCSAGSR